MRISRGMLFALLLAGCPPDEEPPQESAPPIVPGPEPCVPTDPVETPLDWTQASASGVSAQDVFGFAVGDHTATLTWDDETTTVVTLSVTPVSAVETSVGPADRCPVALDVLVNWRFSTADGRLIASDEARWSTPDARADHPPGGVIMNAVLDPTTLNLTRLNATSRMFLRSYLAGDGTLESLVVSEVWPLDVYTNRVCVRGSLDPAAIECHDTGESTGPD